MLATYSLVYLQFYHSSGDNVMAVTKMEDAQKRYPSSLDFEAVNILAEILISLKSFHEAFQVWTESRSLIGLYGRQVYYNHQFCTLFWMSRSYQMCFNSFLKIVLV